MVIHPENALKFDFLVDKGDVRLKENQKREEYNQLIKYFLASLTVPDQDQWVNLSPYEKNRIIADDFGKTEMGRDLLAQDYLLKQITSSLMYPESGLGKNFWDKVYARAYKEYGTTDIPVSTFNKVWIVPDKALIYESGNTAYVVKSHLKVMLEEDYLSLQKHSSVIPEKSGIQSLHSVSSTVIKEIILPEIEREVNEGKNFTMLRQVYSGMLLATWYKKTLKESLLVKIYADKAKLQGLMSSPNALIGDPEHIYQQYLVAFKKGVYSYIKEDTDKYTNQVVPRKYFSGGFWNNSAMVTDVKTVSDAAMVEAIRADASSMDDVTVLADPAQSTDAAMQVKKGGVRKIYTKPKPQKAGHIIELMSADGSYIKMSDVFTYHAQAGSLRDLFYQSKSNDFIAYLVPIQQLPISVKALLRKLEVELGKGKKIDFLEIMEKYFKRGIIFTPYIKEYKKEKHFSGSRPDYHILNRSEASVFKVPEGTVVMALYDLAPEWEAGYLEKVIRASIRSLMRYHIRRNSVLLEKSIKGDTLILMITFWITMFQAAYVSENTQDAHLLKMKRFFEQNRKAFADVLEDFTDNFKRDFAMSGKKAEINPDEEDLRSALKEIQKGWKEVLFTKVLTTKRYFIALGDLREVKIGKDLQKSVLAFVAFFNKYRDIPGIEEVYYKATIPRLVKLGYYRKADPAMNARSAPGGIDMNSAHLDMQIIKRDGLGVPLPFSLQDSAMLSRITGFVPRIIEIKPALLLFDSVEKK